MTATAKLSSKGQLVVPSEIRKILNAEEGDRVIFKTTDYGILLEVEKRVDLMSLFGSLQIDDSVDVKATTICRG